MKFFFKILLGIVTFTFLSVISFYFYLKSSYTNVISESNYNKLVKDIKSSKPLKNEFYDLYEIQYPESLNKNFNSLIIKSIFTDKILNSPIQDVSKIYLSKTKIYERSHLFKQNDISLSLNLEDEVDSKEALNWIIENSHIGVDNKSIKLFLEDYYNKKIEDFNIKELAGIVTLIKNPSLYNPYKKMVKYDMRVNMLINIYKKNKVKK